MNYTDLRLDRLDQLSTQETLNFEYGVLEAESTNEIKSPMRHSSHDIIDIG